MASQNLKKLFIGCASTARQVTAGLKSVMADKSVLKKEDSKGCPS